MIFPPAFSLQSADIRAFKTVFFHLSFRTDIIVQDCFQKQKSLIHKENTMFKYNFAHYHWSKSVKV